MYLLKKILFVVFSIILIGKGAKKLKMLFSVKEMSDLYNLSKKNDVFRLNVYPFLDGYPIFSSPIIRHI